MPDDSLRIPAEALEAAGELLAAAEQYGLGVALEPEGDGWRVHDLIDDWPAYQEIELKGGQAIERV